MKKRLIKRNKAAKKMAFIIYISMALILLTSCAEAVSVRECVSDDLYGFWSGLWHGIISPVTFLISLFKDDVAMYAINNNGGWYDFGFVLGAGILFGGGGKAS